jgi:thiamine-phosphate pyrophosphorylase
MRAAGYSAVMTDPCRLYLVTPPALPERFPALLASALEACDAAAVRLSLAGADEAALVRAIGAVRPVTERFGVALVLEGTPELARRHGCDGVHLDSADADVAAARRVLGDDLQLGVFCGGSRDGAMRAGEAGADYVAFGPYDGADDDLLGWWAELMELPVVAEGVESVALCAAAARAGADFVAVRDVVWRDPAGPAQAARALQAALVAA